jgi:hypothetical protein
VANVDWIKIISPEQISLMVIQKSLTINCHEGLVLCTFLSSSKTPVNSIINMVLELDLKI